MIVDISLFYNEFDMAEIRVNELEGVVDRFVFISGARTFQGNDNSHRLPDHIMSRNDVEWMSFLPEGRLGWDAEHYLRGRVSRVVDKLNPMDIAIVTDADEIPSAQAVTDITLSTGLTGPVNLTVDQYYYKFDNYMRKQSCPVVFRAKDYTDIRSMRFDGVFPAWPGGGWEFSFFGGVDFIQNKLENYSHSELVVPEYHAAENISRRIEQRVDIVDRPKEGQPSIPLPEYVLRNRERFEDYW